jgi:hypothetical protein
MTLAGKRLQAANVMPSAARLAGSASRRESLNVFLNAKGLKIMPISELIDAQTNLVKAAKNLDATRGPLSQARAALAEAEARTADARARLEAATAAEQDLLSMARRDEFVGPGDLQAARAAISTAETAVELATAGETPARDAYAAAARTFNTALAAHRHAEAIADYWRQIDTAHRLDEALALAERLAAELHGPLNGPVFITVAHKRNDFGEWDFRDVRHRNSHSTIEALLRRAPLPRAA